MEQDPSNWLFDGQVNLEDKSPLSLGCPLLEKAEVEDTARVKSYEQHQPSFSSFWPDSNSLFVSFHHHSPSFLSVRSLRTHKPHTSLSWAHMVSGPVAYTLAIPTAQIYTGKVLGEEGLLVQRILVPLVFHNWQQTNVKKQNGKIRRTRRQRGQEESRCSAFDLSPVQFLQYLT